MTTTTTTTTTPTSTSTTATTTTSYNDVQQPHKLDRHSGVGRIKTQPTTRQIRPSDGTCIDLSHGAVGPPTLQSGKQGARVLSSCTWMFLASVVSLFVRLLLADVVWGFAERLDRNFAWNFGRSLHAKLPAEGFMGGRAQRKTLRKSKRHYKKNVAKI